MKPAFVTCLLSLLFSFEGQAAPARPPVASKDSPGKPQKVSDQNSGAARIERDVVYGQAGEVAVKLDLSPITQPPLWTYITTG